MRTFTVQSQRSQLTRGFTLIEMLVVVSIIVLLIAMLLPALGRARDAAKQTVCASNLEQLGTGMMTYGGENMGKIPIGYIDNARGSNYHMIWAHNAPKRYMMLGALYESGHVTSGQSFYCPSQKHVGWQYDAPSNQWNRPYLSGSTKKPTRSGYSTRPAHNTRDWKWGSHPSPTPPVNMPRIQSLDGITIVTDITSLKAAHNASHAAGLNALHANGSVNWVDHDVYGNYLENTLYAGLYQQLWTAIDGD
jgi:prepilin-type N-terminal cleavage/methylation domain-containing protein